MISNFIKHFTRAHSYQATNNQSKKNDNIQLTDGEEFSSEIIDYCDEKIAADKEEKYVYIEQSTLDSNDLNYSFESLYNFIANNASKMEKKINDQISKQMIKMWNVVTINCESQNQQVQCKCDVVQ